MDPARSWTVGRELTNDVVLPLPEISRHHVRFEHRMGIGWVLLDLGSSNGTWVDGQRVGERVLSHACEAWLGTIGHGALLRLSFTQAAGSPRPDQPPAGHQPASPAPPTALTPTTPERSRLPEQPRSSSSPAVAASPGRLLMVGRDLQADLVIEDLTVSRSHATLRFLGDGRVVVVDLSSGNGTFLNGSRIREAVAEPGDLVTFGWSPAYQLTTHGLVPYESPSNASLVADDLVVTTSSGKTILDHVSFALEPGQLLAVVGTTGAGKSTLTKALTGFRPATGGRVLLNGRDLYDSLDELQPQIGYVPQDDILHTQLRLRAALEYAARLRFPVDVTPADRSARVIEVMQELGLTQHADTRIQSLSGGQRKRTSVALELLTRPALLLLDEPTSGLDPGYEKKVMELLRDLADGDRTVVVVTHSVQSLHLCDRVLFLEPGGRVAFYGPADQAKAFFGQPDFPEIFSLLEEDTSGEWARRFRASSLYERYLGAPLRAVPPPATGTSASVPSSRPQRDAMQQWRTLVRRQSAVMAADRKQFGLLLVATVIGGLAILAALQGHALDPAHPPPVDGRKLLGTLGLAASVLGAAAGLREIVKERAILDRERATGLSMSAYLLSKAAVIGVACLVQATLLTILSTARAAGPPEGALLPAGRLELILGAAAMTFVGMTLGLLISSVVATSEQAMSLVVLVIIFEYLLSGAAVDLSNKPVLRLPAYVAGSNWGVAAMASSSDLPRLDQCGARGSGSGLPPLGCDGRWTHSPGQWLWDMTGMATLAAATLALTLWILVRQYRPRHRHGGSP